MPKRISLFLILIIAVAALGLAAKPSPKVKVKVLDRVRLDVETEDLEYVSNGPLAGQLVIIDESHVFGMRADGHGNSKVKWLFDVPDVPGRPNGIAYVESLQLFVIDTRDHPDTLYFVDHKGKVQYTRTIQYLNGYWPNDGVEGLAYIPVTSQYYPDHLVLVTLDYDPNTDTPDNGHLQIIGLDGTVERDITVPPEISAQMLVAAVTFLPPDRLIFGGYEGNAVLTFDFRYGTFASKQCPDCVGLIDGFEGLARTATGLIIGAGVYGNLVYFDEDLNRLPELDQVYAPNLHLVGLRGIAWDSRANQFLVHHRPPAPSPLELQAHVAAVPPNLDSAALLADIDKTYIRVGGLAYLPDEDRFAMSHHFAGGSSPSILIFDKTAGSPHQTVDLTNLGYGYPAPLTYIPSTQQFAVSFSNRPTILDILDRNGNGMRSRDFASMGVVQVRSVVFFNPGHPSGGQFLIHVEPGRRVLITDFNLNVLSEFDAYPELGLSRIGYYYDLVAITSGKDAGAFGMIGDSGELVIFSIK